MALDSVIKLQLLFLKQIRTGCAFEAIPWTRPTLDPSKVKIDLLQLDLLKQEA